MNILYILLIAVALGIDAFAVSLGAGSYFGKATARQKFRLSFHFGLFQFFMPILGWCAGSEIVKYIAAYDHWLAFAILSIIGVKMIIDSKDSESLKKDITRGFSLILVAIATSIDALGVGFSLGVIKESIIYPSIIIGIVASVMSLIGIKLGEKLSTRFGRRISIFGGIILILIGIHIVLEHLDWI